MPTTECISSISDNNYLPDPISEEAIAKMDKAFRKIPSYQETISADDIPAILLSAGIVRPTEVVKKWQEFFKKFDGGRMEINKFMNYKRVQHDPEKLLEALVNDIDRNGDGYISLEEYQYGLEVLVIHNPNAKNMHMVTNYDQMVKEADLNKDGKISVEELKEWLRKN